MSTNRTIKGRVFDVDCCPYVEFWGYCILGMCDVRDVGCSGCGMLAMWDVGDVGYWGCGMFGMWDVRDSGFWRCGMFGIWDVWDVGCSGCGIFAGMWDIDLQNAAFCMEISATCLFTSDRLSCTSLIDLICISADKFISPQ